MKTHSLLDVLFKQRSKPRGDEHLTHCVDLYGCDRATWYRRKGLRPFPFTKDKLAQFAIGHGYEAAVRETLFDAGLDLEPDGLEVAYRGLAGHPDIVVKGKVVIEVKTTELRTPKPEVSPHYAIQAAFYALALNVRRAIVLVKHAGSHAETTYEVDPEDWREAIEDRAMEIIQLTDPSAPLPPAEPGELAPWGCRYCDYRQCERNPNFGSRAPK